MQHDLNVARALTWRYLIALSLIAALSSAAWVSLHLVISEQENTAAVVNVSGRQRMLSQRTALFSNLLVNSSKAKRPLIRDKLKESIELMARSHYGLTHGNQEMGLPNTLSPTVRAMYFEGSNPLDVQVETYIETVRHLLLEKDDALTPDNLLLHHICDTAPTTLVVALDKMVSQYQLEGEASVNSVAKAELILWLLTLFLLVAEALLIFQPFVRHIKAVIGKLQRVTNELELHQTELETLVQQRTTDLESKSKALIESEEKFRLISTNAREAIIIIGANAQVCYWNPAAEQMFGYKPDEVMGKNLHDFLAPPKQRDAAHSAYRSYSLLEEGKLVSKTVEVVSLRKNGEEFPIELSISSIKFQNSWHALGIIRDITERKQMEEQVRQLALYDTLTNLPNRRLFGEYLNQAMATSKRNCCYCALIFLDLDNFKPLNDTHGHTVGDSLLIEAAVRLKSCLREMDTVARFGGDEFVVMLNQLDSDKDRSTLEAEVVAEKIRTSLAKPYRMTISREGKPAITIEHHCTVSIGVALFLDHDGSPDEIIQCADDAMYQAKEAGRNLIRFYESKA